MPKLIDPKDQFATGEKLREALLTADTAKLEQVAKETFGNPLSKTESTLLRDAIDVYTAITGVVGAQTVGKVLKGTHSQHKNHPCHGKFRGAPHSEADLTRLGWVVHYALAPLANRIGDAFGPDHTFQAQGIDPKTREEILTGIQSYHETLPGAEPDFTQAAPEFTKKMANKATKDLAGQLSEALLARFRKPGKQTSTYWELSGNKEAPGEFTVRYKLLHRYEGNPANGYPATVLEAEFRVLKDNPKNPTVILAAIGEQLRNRSDDKSQPWVPNRELLELAQRALEARTKSPGLEPS